MAKKKTETTNNLEVEQIITEMPVEASATEMPKTVTLDVSTDFDVERQRKKQRAAKITQNVFVYIFLTICAVLAFLPFYWMVISSLKTEPEYRQSNPTFFPHTFQWKNYPAVLAQSDNNGSNFLANSIKYACRRFLFHYNRRICYCSDGICFGSYEFQREERIVCVNVGDNDDSR